MKTHDKTQQKQRRIIQAKALRGAKIYSINFRPKTQLRGKRRAMGVR